MSLLQLPDAQVGDVLPLNALTGDASLAQLIDAYNQEALEPITLDVVALSETLAHGRALDVLALRNALRYGRALCADDSSVNFSLMTFSRPHNSQVRLETRVDLTLDWIDEQTKRIGEAVDCLIARFPVVHAIGWARMFQKNPDWSPLCLRAGAFLIILEDSPRDLDLPGFFGPFVTGEWHRSVG